MGTALARLAEEDPTFKVRTDEETGQTIISGMGELHLDIIVDRMNREFKVECNVGKPQVAYRETIRKAVKAEGKFVRQSGGRGQYGHCWLELIPQEPGAGFEFENKVVGGAIPREYIGPVEMVLKKLWNPVLSLVIQWLTSKLSCLTAPTMTLTPTKWPSKSLVPWALKKVLAKQILHCLNHTCP